MSKCVICGTKYVAERELISGKVEACDACAEAISKNCSGCLQEKDNCFSVMCPVTASRMKIDSAGVSVNLAY